MTTAKLNVPVPPTTVSELVEADALEDETVVDVEEEREAGVTEVDEVVDVVNVGAYVDVVEDRRVEAVVSCLFM